MLGKSQSDTRQHNYDADPTGRKSAAAPMPAQVLHSTQPSHNYPKLTTRFNMDPGDRAAGLPSPSHTHVHLSVLTTLTFTPASPASLNSDWLPLMMYYSDWLRLTMYFVHFRARNTCLDRTNPNSRLQIGGAVALYELPTRSSRQRCRCVQCG